MNTERHATGEQYVLSAPTEDAACMYCFADLIVDPYNDFCDHNFGLSRYFIHAAVDLALE